jgi:hypothetical protein
MERAVQRHGRHQVPDLLDLGAEARFCEVVDAYNCICPIHPERRYRISGNKGDSVYFSLTAYNEPSPGAWSDRILTILRDDDLDIDVAGNFSFELGPTPAAAVLMTRDYQADPLAGRPVAWRIEALDEAEPVRHADLETAAGLRASAVWLRTMFPIVPLAVGVRVDDAHRLRHEIAHAANQFANPYQVPDANFGWSAPDACYSYGSFVLADDKALVITHHQSTCRFRNLVVEPIHGDPLRHRRVLLGQRPQCGAQRRPLGEDRRLSRVDDKPKLADHIRLPPWQSRLPVVSCR